MKKLLLTLSLMLGLANTTHAEPLTSTQLHAVLGIVTNFILDDGITHNGTSYSTVTSPHTGRVWLDRNLGAKRVCTSLDDAQCYGDYYQWGRNADGHQKSGSDVTEVISTNDENVGHGDFIIGSGIGDWVSAMGSVSRRSIKWSKLDGTSVCPVGFRVPKLTEFRHELLLPNSAQINLDSTEKDGNNDDKRINAFNSFLKLPSSGFRQRDAGNLLYLGEGGILASTSLFREGLAIIETMRYFDTIATTTISHFSQGISIRCIKE